MINSVYRIAYYIVRWMYEAVAYSLTPYLSNMLVYLTNKTGMYTFPKDTLEIATEFGMPLDATVNE